MLMWSVNIETIIYTDNMSFNYGFAQQTGLKRLNINDRNAVLSRLFYLNFTTLYYYHNIYVNTGPINILQKKILLKTGKWCDLWKLYHKTCWTNFSLTQCGKVCFCGKWCEQANHCYGHQLGSRYWPAIATFKPAASRANRCSNSSDS